LGRGLSALIPTAEPLTQASQDSSPRDVAVDRITPSPFQPRRTFDEAKLEELATSIRYQGIIQPLVVRPQGDGFELIAGERRWRAAMRAGLSRVPVVIRHASDHEALQLALVENLQREDLNPMEEAQAYERLIADFGMTQDEVARRVGKNRTTIANMLRLLRLPAEVQQWLRENRLTTGHAKALLSLSDLSAILDSAKKIIQGDYSVRQAEVLVSRYSSDTSANDDSVGGSDVVDPNVKAAIHALEQALGTKVTVQESRGKGKIELHFFSIEEMNRLYEGLLRAKF